MHAPPHPLDPNFLDFSEPDFHIFAGANADIECLVDEVDYLYFTKWLWLPKISPCGKIYLKRSYSVYDILGHRDGAVTLYLHIEICRRFKGDPPTKRHKIVDHLNGNSLDNRRCNLRWATSKQNNRNRFGSALLQGDLL